MIVLNTPTPSSTAELVQTLRTLLAGLITVTDHTVSAKGAFPALSRLTLDVTGAAPLPHPAANFIQPTGHEVGAFTADEFSLVGRPFGRPDRLLDLQVTARQVRGAFMDTGNGQIALKLAGASDGKLRATVRKQVLETTFLAEANKAAKTHGVDIREIHSTFTTLPADPRRLSADIVLKAKKGFLPAATIRIRGMVNIDAQLTANLSGLSVEGEGIVGGVAASFIRPKLASLNGSAHSLLSLPLDDLVLTDVRLATPPDQLCIEADFAAR